MSQSSALMAPEDVPSVRQGRDSSAFEKPRRGEKDLEFANQTEGLPEGVHRYAER